MTIHQTEVKKYIVPSMDHATPYPSNKELYKVLSGFDCKTKRTFLDVRFFRSKTVSPVTNSNITCRMALYVPPKEDPTKLLYVTINYGKSGYKEDYKEHTAFTKALKNSGVELTDSFFFGTEHYVEVIHAIGRYFGYTDIQEFIFA